MPRLLAVDILLGLPCRLAIPLRLSAGVRSISAALRLPVAVLGVSLLAVAILGVSLLSVAVRLPVTLLPVAVCLPVALLSVAVRLRIALLPVSRLSVGLLGIGCLGRCLPVVLPAASGRIGAAGLARCLLGNRTAGRHGIGVRVTGHAGSVRCFRCRCGSAFRGICGAVRCTEIFRNICRIRCKGIRCVRHRRLSAGKPCPAVGTVLGALRQDLAAGFTSQHRVYLRN